MLLNIISFGRYCMNIKLALIIWISLFGFTSSSQAVEMIQNGNFTDGISGWWSTEGTITTNNNNACIDIAHPGENSWSVILGHGGIGLKENEKYTINFNAYADKDTQFKTLIQHTTSPYTHYFLTDTLLTTTPTNYRYQFTHQQPSDTEGEFQFQMGAQEMANICVSNISIEGIPYIETEVKSPIRLNQLGFLPTADKFIFVESDSTQPLDWTLKNSQGINIDIGKTTIFGLNKASEEYLHQINLSTLTTLQTGLTITVGDDTSTPFNIQPDLYNTLKYDALSYFYQNRSGIDIEPQYVQRPDLARPAGHPKDIATCFDKIDAWGNQWPGCDFSIDATGGWYDAGDHGKYMVNSGITTWTLLNLYERGKWIKKANIPFSEGLVKIPEATNEVNPLLSEARWNIEFMLSMQIPKGKIVAAPIGDQSSNKTLNLTKIDASYLAFHKIADEAWTGMPLPPHKDNKIRYVGQPSTAATLNLVAIGAQCARIWKEIDPTFSAQCLKAAENGWRAAQAHPNIYAYDNFTGSGPYNDLTLTDEFYWASTELFITTGENKYRQYIKNSPDYLVTPKGNIASEGEVFWQYTAPLATISLAVVPNTLPKEAIALAQQAIIKTATAYKKQIDHEGYRIPYTVKEYSWGSNSNLVNRGIFLIYANDFTDNPSFIKAAASAMDYILGANPMNISYVTGYGSRFAQHPHHRFWANSADQSAPAPAPGALIGGPNSVSFSDPIAATMKGSCIQQTCYRDNISAWTLNEITINWNAPLVWLTTALDEGKLN